MNDANCRGFLEAQSILRDVGFEELREVDFDLCDAVRGRMSKLWARPKRAKVGLGTQVWDRRDLSDSRCASKTIAKLASGADCVACWFDPPDEGIWRAVAPSAPWAHLLNIGVRDLYLMPLPNLEWSFVKTHEAEFGPFLLPKELAREHRLRHQPQPAVLGALVDAMRGVIEKGDTMSAIADYEAYAVRVRNGSSDVILGVDRLDHRFFAVSTAREPGESNSSWRSWERSAAQFVNILTEVQTGDSRDMILVKALQNPDCADELASRLALVEGKLARARKRPA